MGKTNAIRILEKEGISYELREYDIEEDAFTAEGVAEVLSLIHI